MPGKNKLRVEEKSIKKLAQEKPRDYYLFKYMRQAKDRPGGRFSGREPGFALQVGLTVTGSTDAWGVYIPFVGLDMKAMYHTKSNWSLGLGTGLTPYGTGGIIPFYVESQRLLGPNGQKTRPYLFGQLGYGYAAWENWGSINLRGGPMGRFGAGYVISTRRRTEWIFSLSVGLQPMQWENEWDWPVTQNSRIHSALQLGLGLSI
jgi:hypothetical protein